MAEILASTRKTRNGSVDALRGIAIIAVVLGHANTGVVAAGLVDEHHKVLSNLNAALYLVHMPLFAFLMGLNMPRAWEKRSHPRYLVDRLIFFLWLYLVWTAIQGLFQVFAGKYQNGESTTLLDVIDLWHPIAHMWFLPWAMLVSLIVLGTQPWKPRFISWLVLACSVVLSVYTWGNTGLDILHLGMGIVAFTVLGAVIGLDRFVKISQVNSIWLVFISLIGWASYLYILIAGVANTRPTSGDPTRTPVTIGYGILATVSGCLAVIVTVILVYKFFSAQWLEYLGKMSLQIFLAHLLFTPAIRVGMVKIGLEQPWVIDIVATSAGVLGPLAIYHLTRRYLPWLFASPISLTR